MLLLIFFFLYRIKENFEIFVTVTMKIFYFRTEEKMSQRDIRGTDYPAQKYGSGSPGDPVSSYWSVYCTKIESPNGGGGSFSLHQVRDAGVGCRGGSRNRANCD